MSYSGPRRDRVGVYVLNALARVLVSRQYRDRLNATVIRGLLANAREYEQMADRLQALADYPTPPAKEQT
jgi:hypothetical protein